MANFEYKTITVNNDIFEYVLNKYLSFGWEAAESVPTREEILSREAMSGDKRVSLKLKREGNYVNIAELKRLESQFDTCIRDIQTMEERKKLLPVIMVCTMGVIGCLCIAEAVIARSHGFFGLLIAIILGFLGVCGIVLPYFIFPSISQNQNEKLDPIILAKYQESELISEKIVHLLG